MPHRTPLHEIHLALGARMVDFAGWDMPLQYTSIAQEHQAVRTAAGMFDISHMGRFWLAGAEALPLVQRIFTNNAATLKSGQVRYGLVCNDRGGILDDVLVYGFSSKLGMVVNASNREKIFGWIQNHQTTPAVPLLDTTAESCMIAVQGPKALDVVRGITSFDAAALPYYFSTQTSYQGKDCLLSRTGYTGEDGVELIVSAAQGPVLWNELRSRGAFPCGLGARDTLRLEAAMPLYGHELSEEIDPLQAGLGWAVKFDKGDFIGREALLKRKEDANRPVRVGLEIAGKRIAREQAAVLAGGEKIGGVTSGTFAPTLEKAIAMAYVGPAHASPGTVCEVDIRGKTSPATVARLPFYERKRKS
jgi:aminomethyltransferase